MSVLDARKGARVLGASTGEGVWALEAVHVFCACVVGTRTSVLGVCACFSPRACWLRVGANGFGARLVGSSVLYGNAGKVLLLARLRLHWLQRRPVLVGPP